MNGLRVAAFGLRGLQVEGGIETHARELYPRLAALGCRITVFTRARYDAAPHSSGDVETRPLPAPGGKGIETALHALLATLACIKHRPDIVHVHGIGPALFTPLLRLCGLRVVVTVHGHDYDATKWGSMARLALRVAERVGVRTANAVITVSQSLRRDVQSSFGVDADAIYNGCYANEQALAPAEPQLAALAAGRYVLIVGRLTQHKRVEDVIAAFASLPGSDLRLVICGKSSDDPYCATLRSLAALDARVVLAGYVAPDRLPWLYRRAGCTVMASSHEGMPLAVLEALANGSRVILTDIPAHTELALPLSSYYRVGDVGALAMRLRAVLAAPQTAERTTLGPQFEWPTIARQTLAVLQRAAERSS